MGDLWLWKKRENVGPNIKVGLRWGCIGWRFIRVTLFLWSWAFLYTFFLFSLSLFYCVLLSIFVYPVASTRIFFLYFLLLLFLFHLAHDGQGLLLLFGRPHRPLGLYVWVLFKELHWPKVDKWKKLVLLLIVEF